MKVVFGSDHAGYRLKEFLKENLKSAISEVLDIGTDSEKSVDYPDYAKKAALKIMEERADVGILVCGTGIGISIAANKLSGIRAAACSSIFEAVMARRHNNANILCLGSRVTGDLHALAIAESFLSEKFEGGRHKRRVDKITGIEREVKGEI